jgi:hypothetical protein
MNKKGRCGALFCFLHFGTNGGAFPPTTSAIQRFFGLMDKI